MVELDCGPDRYPSKDRKTCCGRCQAGKYVSSQCNATTETKCVVCQHDSYIDTENHMGRCIPCRDCSSDNQITAKKCEAHKNRQCKCMAGFYCMEGGCVKCQAVTHCPVGKGVKVQATDGTDAICVPCPPGTYSNVSDYHSPCQKYTSCDDLGRMLKTAGSPEADAVCGDIKCSSWVLPAGLWTGLVLTSLLIVLLGIMYWKVKRKSYRPAIPSDPDVTVVPVAPTQFCPVQPHFPSREWDGHCQESTEEKDCKAPLYGPDDTVISHFTLDSLPTTPTPASVQSVQLGHVTGNAGGYTSPLMRNHSEPQEDEWGEI